MDTNVKHQAKKVIDTLYDWLFDGEGYTTPTPAGQSVKSYVAGDDMTSGSIIDKVLGSIGNVKGRYSSLQDHAIAVVTSAASAVSTVVAKHDHIGAATTGIPGQGHVPRPSFTFFDNGRSTGNSDSVLSFFRSFYDNPSVAFDDLLGHHYPHFDSLIARLGLDELAKSLNADPRILFLAFLLPLIVLLLSACCIMGAGYSTKEPHGPGYHEHKKKSEPTLVGGKSDGQGSSSSTSSHAAGSSSGSLSSSAKGGKGKGKKGGAHDNAGGSLAEEPVPKGSQLGNNNNVASWASRLGATGFRGADVLDFKPFDIYDIIGSTKAQHDQDEITLDNQDDDVENIFDSAKEFISSAASQAKKHVHDIKEINTDSGHQHTLSQANIKSTKAGPAGPGSEPQVRTRIPRPHSFKEADRHRHQPHIPSSPYGLSSSSSSRQRPDGVGNAIDQGHGDQLESTAAKIMDFAQGNSTMKTLDGISGGVLGATFATVAALANTAEAATTFLKENTPSLISEFFNDLQESFDESMENGGLEGTGFDDQPRVSRIQVTELPDSTFSSKSVDSGSSVSTTKKANPSSSAGSAKAWPSSYGPMADNENKKKSSSSSWNKDVASTSASKAAPVSSSSANAARARSASTSGEANKGHTMATNPLRLRQRSEGHAQPGIPAAASSAAPSKSDSGRPAGVEDSTAGLKPKHAVYSDYVGKGPSESTFAAVASSGLDKHTKTTADAVVHDVQAKLKEADKTAKKATSDVKKAVDSGLTSAQKAKETVVHNVQGKAKQADSAIKKAVADTQKATGSGLASAQKAKDTIVHDIQEKAKEADATAKKVASDTKKTVESGVSYAQKAKESLVKDAQAAAQDTETTVENAVHSAEAADQKATKVAKGTVNAGIASAQKTKDAAVAQAQKLAEGAEQAAEAVVDQAKAIVNSTFSVAQLTKDTVVHAAEDAAFEAETILEAAVKQGQDNVEAFLTNTHAAADKVVADVKGTAKNAEKSVETAAKNAKENIDSTVASAQQAKNRLSSDVTKAVNKASEDAKKAVDGASGVVHDAEKKIETTAQKAKSNASQAAKEVEKKVATTVKIASASAQKVKENAAKAAKDAEKTVEDSVHTATTIAQRAKDSATQAAQEIHKRAESAVDSAFDAAQKARADASHVAKEIKKSVDSAKKTAEHSMRAASSAQKAKNTAAKDLNKAASNAGQSAKVAETDVQETIKAAMEYARNTTNDPSIQSAKVALDSAISSAHKTESHVAQNLKDAAHRAESVAHKASGDAKAALNSALAAAHEVESHHADAHSEHLDAYGTPLSAFTLGTPAHLDHPIEHTHDIKKAFVFGHNSPRLGNKETRFVSGSPLSSSSSDPKPVLKAAHNAHHAHHDGDSGDGTHSKSKTAHDNHTGGEYSFFLNDDDLLDDANADDGGEEDSDDTHNKSKASRDNHTDGEHSFFLNDNDLLDDANADDGGEEDSDDTHIKSKTTHHNHTGGERSFFLNDNDLLDDANADDGGEEDSDDNDSHDQPGHGGRGILSAAPSILQSAKSAASAVAARVADASHQQLDNARHRLSNMVGHMADNLAGSDQLDDDEDDVEGEDRDSTSLSFESSTTSTPSTSGTHQHESHAHGHLHHHVTIEDATDSLSDVADNVSEIIHSARTSAPIVAKDVKALAKHAAKSVSQHTSAAGKTHDEHASHSKDHKSHGDSKIYAHNENEDVHAYKPDLSSSHMDKDGFIVVEAPENAHEHGVGHIGATELHRTSSSSSSSSSSSIKQHPTSHAPAPAKSHSTPSQQHSGAATSKKHSSPPTGLSYSGIVQLHVNNTDHGSQMGISENRSKPASHSPFQNEDYEQLSVSTTQLGNEVASVISHGGDQILPPVVLNAPSAPQHGNKYQHHHQNPHVLVHHPHDASVAPRRISSAAPPTTTLSLEHGHG
ncbi:hypothetical protein CPC16_000936 [Podila verticillata]|nr:hypothetical protein CPC16_000936 [Podila verticillata]